MENRRDTLGVLKICRFCLAQNRSLGSLYEKTKSKNTVSLPLKILSSVSIEVLPSDKKPTFICQRCKFFMNIFYDYKHIVRQADEGILQYVQNGTPLGTVSWPSSLTRIFRSITDSETVKTVVEDGTTIQVTSHEISDSDEEDGNVYNVKIGDDEDTKTCIKVVTSKETKVKENNASGKDTSNNEESKGTGSSISGGCWACDLCDCTYPLQQLLNLHKMQKHRNREVACSQCDAKFFTKYDLASHQVRHSVEMPFQCVACDKKFKRLILLKRHEKVIHPDIPQLLCPNCPATFISNEELEMHQEKHNRVQKPHACTQCEKKFQEKSALQRHIEVIHNKAAEFRCEYCPERFGSVTKLMRHVRSHVGERSYPCKFCDKSFMKSHHYTRHLRLKHRDQTRLSTQLGPQEQYRCEQCDDTFESQDDLIYHSAIHATQNLTCPLCQEKFDDVEAVTTHIKSHVNGVEFMCDYCELIFTTQEKLNAHLITVHDDEIQNDIEDESSMEMMDEDEEDDNGINVKEEGDEMIIEINKPANYLVSDNEGITDKVDNINSEESESEVTYTELQTVDTLAIIKNEPSSDEPPPDKVSENPDITMDTAANTMENIKIVRKPVESQAANVLQKADEVKRKVPRSREPSDAVIQAIKKINPVIRVESTNSGGASDKSLRLLEKELQDLKRTNSRNTETSKISSNKVLETLKSKRPQFQTSTPKLRSAEEKKLLSNKSLSVEKKQVEKRIVTKENKEPKETKEVKSNGNSKEEKDKEKEKDKDNNEKDIKEREKEKTIEKDKGKETSKTIIKNGSATERMNTEEGVRRSTRPSKIKDYAKMIRESTQEISDEDETTEDDEDYCEPDKSTETRRVRRPSQPARAVSAPKTNLTTSPANTPRKRGRPRKDNKEVPIKVKKENTEEVVEVTKGANESQGLSTTNAVMEDTINLTDSNSLTEIDQSLNKSPESTGSPSTNVMVSPTGQTLKKVPVKALPPRIKAMPLPANARPKPAPELCEMQIGKKVVKVQKIVMTKAEVEAMAKKGLVEMKGGTMVLKQGIKLPSSDSPAVKATLMADGETLKREKAAPTRCELDDES